MSTNRIYVGGLDSKTGEKDLEDAFKSFGNIKSIDMKEVQKHGKYFAFVEFEEDRDAQEAIAAMNQKRIGSCDNVSVEASKPKREPNNNRRNGGDRGGRYGDRDRDRGGRRGVQHGRYQLAIENLPDRVTWQELKDFASGPRHRWNCVFADVNDRKHIGRVEYDHPDDMEDAYRMLHKERWLGFTIYTYKMNSRDLSPSPPRRDSRRGGGRSDSPPPPHSP